eukprot:345957-Rhodomonas_salina.3
MTAEGEGQGSHEGPTKPETHSYSQGNFQSGVKTALAGLHHGCPAEFESSTIDDMIRCELNLHHRPGRLQRKRTEITGQQIAPGHKLRIAAVLGLTLLDVHEFKLPDPSVNDPDTAENRLHWQEPLQPVRSAKSPPASVPATYMNPAAAPGSEQTGSTARLRLVRPRGARHAFWSGGAGVAGERARRRSLAELRDRISGHNVHARQARSTAGFGLECSRSARNAGAIVGTGSSSGAGACEVREATSRGPGVIPAYHTCGGTDLVLEGARLAPAAALHGGVAERALWARRALRSLVSRGANVGAAGGPGRDGVWRIAHTVLTALAACHRLVLSNRAHVARLSIGPREPWLALARGRACAASAAARVQRACNTRRGASLVLERSRRTRLAVAAPRLGFVGSRRTRRAALPVTACASAARLRAVGLIRSRQPGWHGVQGPPVGPVKPGTQPQASSDEPPGAEEELSGQAWQEEAADMLWKVPAGHAKQSSKPQAGLSLCTSSAGHRGSANGVRAFQPVLYEPEVWPCGVEHGISRNGSRACFATCETAVVPGIAELRCPSGAEAHIKMLEELSPHGIEKHSQHPSLRRHGLIAERVEFRQHGVACNRALDEPTVDRVALKHGH